MATNFETALAANWLWRETTTWCFRINDGLFSVNPASVGRSLWIRSCGHRNCFRRATGNWHVNCQHSSFFLFILSFPCSDVARISLRYKFNSDYIFTRLGTGRTCPVPLKYNASKFWGYKSFKPLTPSYARFCVNMLMLWWCLCGEINNLSVGRSSTFQVGFILLKQNCQAIFQHISTHAWHKSLATNRRHCHLIMNELEKWHTEKTSTACNTVCDIN